MTHATGGRRAAAIAVLLAILGAAGGAEAGAIALHKVPKPVRDAIATRFPDARILGADQDLEEGRTVYELTIKDRGRTLDVTLTPEGAIALIKKEIAPAVLPAPVSRALQARYAGAAYEAVEEVTRVEGARETFARYEVDLTTPGGRRLQIWVSADGTILRGPK